MARRPSVGLRSGRGVGSTDSMPDQQQRRVDAIVESLPALVWERISAGQGSKGERLYDWTMIQGWEEDGWTHGLLVRRSIEEQPEHAYYRFHAHTHKATLETLVRVAGQRWRSNRRFRPPRANAAWTTTKFVTGRAGTDISHWLCWPMPCWPFCAPGEKTIPAGQVPLSVPELRHLLTHLLWRGWHGVDHLLLWPCWRRKHQFRALCCHYRIRDSPPPCLLSATVVLTVCGLPKGQPQAVSNAHVT